MADKLNTAEYDSKGRCVRHPAIRLRKKKMFGGWKIIIGHCPECCLEEMRRVRDEIGAEQDVDIGGGGGRGERERSHRKEKKKKSKSSNRERRSKHRSSAADSISEVGSEGHQRSPNGRAGSHQHQHPPPGPHPGHHPQAPHRDGDSEVTGSTAPTSMDGNGSVVSEQYVRGQHHHAGREAHYQHQQQHQPPAHYPYQQQQQHGHYDQRHAPPPPPPQRTMVLSMAFTDPQTGQRGTYTGQVNSINNKPDGKGTVYYSNGSIAEGTWANGMLMENEDDHGNPTGGGGGGFDQHNRGRGSVGHAGGGRGDAQHQFSPPPPEPNRSRSTSRSARKADPPHHGGGREGGGSQPPQRSSRHKTRERSAPPVDNGGQPPPGGASSFTGNLDRLDKLGGKSRRAPRGASTSVQSYNSRGSNSGMSHNLNMPSGSASVQEYGYASGSQSMGVPQGGGGGGGVYGGGNPEYRRGDAGYNQRGQHQQHGHNNPPGYR